MLRITWDAAAVPEGGFHITCSPAAFAKAVGKEPAGAPFHEYAMRQAGLIGTPTHHRAFSSRSFQHYSYDAFSLSASHMISVYR